MSMSGRDYNSDEKVDGGWAMMMMFFMREGGGQSVQVCVVGSSKTEALAQIVRKIDAITCCASFRNQKEDR